MSEWSLFHHVIIQNGNYVVNACHFCCRFSRSRAFSYHSNRFNELWPSVFFLSNNNKVKLENRHFFTKQTKRLQKRFRHFSFVSNDINRPMYIRISVKLRENGNAFDTTEKLGICFRVAFVRHSLDGSSGQNEQ